MINRRSMLKSCAAIAAVSFSCVTDIMAKDAHGDRDHSPPDLPLASGAKVLGFGHSFIQRAGWGILVNEIPRDMNASNARGVLPWIRLWDQRFNLDVFIDPNNNLGKNNFVSGAFQGVGGDHIVRDGHAPGTLPRTPYVIARAPDIVYLDIGTNDISGGVNAAELIALLDQQISMLIRSGIWVVVQTITDRKSWPEGHPKQLVVTAVNDWLLSQDGRTGLRICDLTKSGFNYPAFDFTLFGGDVIHPNPKGARAIALTLLPILQEMVKPFDAVNPDQHSSGNMWPNFGLRGTEGSKTPGAVIGEVATDHRIIRVAGDSIAHCSKEMSEQGHEKQVITFIPSGTKSENRVEQWRFCTSNSLDLSASGIVPGKDWLEALLFVEASSWIGWLSLELQIAVDGTQPYVARGGLINPDAKTQNLPLGDDGFSGWFRICRFQIPEQINPKALRIDTRPFSIQFDRQATGSGTLKISQPVLRKASDPRSAWNIA